ncbi:hypothetical protein BT96DRAFT_948644 [Gymnopus androsaceus JB14]|uniref:Uncharacterized protein n=1 Tax=Gymnopus androsaceus JB14 TaxID=1447944 RepID=A0A6A4GMT7_9AGAR|nr:hypothetical protein BT96DRAFT_948644 [Gymnopus androsaceus JB14]
MQDQEQEWEEQAWKEEEEWELGFGLLFRSTDAASITRVHSNVNTFKQMDGPRSTVQNAASSWTNPLASLLTQPWVTQSCKSMQSSNFGLSQLSQKHLFKQFGFGGWLALDKFPSPFNAIWAINCASKETVCISWSSLDSEGLAFGTTVAVMEDTRATD